MTARRTNGLVAAIIMAMCSGCALDDGRAWGELELAAAVGFSPSPDRLSPAGELLTVQNEAVHIDKMVVHVERLAARWAPTTAKVAFDPANPPPGYSLCHSGHCHKDDGTLPTYDQIKAELAQGTGGGLSVTWVASGAADGVDVAKGSKTVATASCAPSCFMERGALTQWTAVVSSVAIQGRARSTAKGASGVLPWRPFELQIDKDLVIVGAANVPFDRDHDPSAKVALQMDLPPSLLDDIVFEPLLQVPAGSDDDKLPLDLSSMTTVTAAIADRITTHTKLMTVIVREQ
ncbi:MAG: hypothetical protein KC502_11310 [Myxococcales bacterium]|nr:hypothetical protein [Myxococcales bacterium]